jgi:endonuclease G
VSDERADKVKRYLEWITPEGGLEAMAAEPTLIEGLADVPWADAVDAERAGEAVRRLQQGDTLTPEQTDVVEAIVLPKERPVVDIVDGTYATPPAPFEHLGDAAARATVEAAIPSIGRVELPDHPSLPYGGTGFVVGNGLLMTNRHVAELFAQGLGREELSFRPGQTAALDLLRERDRPASSLFRIVSVAMIHPYWDMALVVVEGLGHVPSLVLAVDAPEDLVDHEVVVIGYPALDPRNNVELQNTIFGGVFNVKRLQPGKLRARADIGSFGHVVSAVTHDSSTLGGNSGSALVDVATGRVVGLHFAGRYLEANFAVPTRELALDGRVLDAGVQFQGAPAGAGGPLLSDPYWVDADPANGGSSVAGAERLPPRGAASPGHGEAAVTLSIPLEVTVRVSARQTDGAVAPPADAGIEALVEPFRDEDFADRGGYDDAFLGIPVPLPAVLDESAVSRLDDGSHVLPYEHFAVVVDKNRRLALFTASNVDADPAKKEPEPGRDYTRRGLTGLRENDQEKWFTDPRIPALHQLPDRFFTKDRASFDKGHIVRREDVAWGATFDEVRRANGDTYHVTNCSPQIATFNRSALKGAWGLLENLVLAQAKTERYTLFAGPVLREDDRFFQGVDDEGAVRVAIPRQFWKIVVARAGDELQTFAFLLDQDLANTDLEFAVDEAWRTRMVSVHDLEQLLTGVAFPQELHDSDQIGASGGEAVRAQAAVETVAPG